MKENNAQIYPQNNQNRLKEFAVKNVQKIKVDNNSAVIYNRCSTEKQDSLGWQDVACEGLCKQKSFDIRQTWGEKVSGKTDDREAFKEMVDYVIKNKIHHIVFYSYNRFSRSGDFTLLKKLKKHGVKLHSVSQPVNDETPSGKFTEKLYLLFGEYDNDMRLETIIKGQTSKVRKGEAVSKVPIGYEKLWTHGVQQDPTEKKQCFISKDGKHIKQAFEWAEMNISQKEILKRLRDVGIKLSTAQLSRILRNPFYCGQITSRLLKPGEFIIGKHEPLISVETFLRVNDILNGKNPHGWKMKKENDEMPLKIFVKCGCCGRSISAYPQKGIYYYYKCPNTGCKVNIKNTLLHELFIEKLVQFKLDPNIAPALKEQLIVTYWQLHDSEAAREKPLKDELNRLKNELHTIEFKYVTDVISLELYNKFAPDHKRRIASIEQELESLTLNCANLEKHIDTVINNSNNLLNIWQLLNYAGKQRLQYLVFPSGMTYFKENKQLRTEEINPVFKAISCFSDTYKSHDEPVVVGDADRLPKLYLVFTNANSLYHNLEHTSNEFYEIKGFNPTVWESITCAHQNPATGATEYIQFNYVSNLTGSSYSGTSIIGSGSTTTDINLPFFNHSDNGETMCSGSII